MSEHVLIQPSEPHAHSEERLCAVCDGGLAICKLCGKAEVELDEPCTPKADWLSCCQSHTHAPWCSQYVEKVEKVAETAREAENVSQVNSETENDCCERYDESDRQEQPIVTDTEVRALLGPRYEGAGFTDSEKDALAQIGSDPAIARIHAAMAEDCDCPQHRAGATEIDLAVLQRISAAITRDQTFTSLTTVRAAVMDVADEGRKTGRPTSAGKYRYVPWELSDKDEDYANAQRANFADAVTERILELQRKPHGMDAGLREDALDSQEFYELMQAYRHAGIADQNVTVAAFEAVKSFVRSRDMMHLRKDPEKTW